MSPNAYGMKNISFCLRSKKLVFSSKFSITVVCLLLIGWPQGKNILGNQPNLWVSQSTKVSSKSVTLPFGALFVGCVHGLLINMHPSTATVISIEFFQTVNQDFIKHMLKQECYINLLFGSLLFLAHSLLLKFGYLHSDVVHSWNRFWVSTWEWFNLNFYLSGHARNYCWYYF